jgi:hypothetical protein
MNLETAVAAFVWVCTICIVVSVACAVITWIREEWF